MKKIALAATVFALASMPLLAQQPAPDTMPASPTTQSHPGAQPASPAAAAPEESTPPTAPAAPSPSANNNAAAAMATPAVEMSSVRTELVNKLDTKTAKTGDDVVVQTEASVKAGDGTEIPKGSKLVGHVLGVMASTAGQNSQVVLSFDQAQLKNGQSVAIHSEIQSISPSATAMAASGPEASPLNNGVSNASGSGPSSASGAQRGTPSPGAAPGATVASGAMPGAGASSGAASGAAAGSGPAAGTIVSRNGKIAVRTTSIPGVLLANNAPGEQDPRMAQASGILLGARKDVQLEGGTELVLAVAATGATQ